MWQSLFQKPMQQQEEEKEEKNLFHLLVVRESCSFSLPVLKDGSRILSHHDLIGTALVAHLILSAACRLLFLDAPDARK
jgi:hypothetical protein